MFIAMKPTHGSCAFEQMDPGFLTQVSNTLRRLAHPDRLVDFLCSRRAKKN